MKDLDGEDTAHPGSGGATGIFGALAEEAPAKAETVPLMSVPAAVRPPAVAASSVGFTQLLRTLSNYEPAVEPVRPPVVEAARTTAAPEAGPVFSSAPLTHAAPSSVSAASGTGAPGAGALGAGALTQMFEAAQPVVAPGPVAVVSAPATAAAGSGGFTQLFQSLDSKPQVAVLNVPPAVPAPDRANYPPLAAAPPRPASAGAFTEMFQSLGNDTRTSSAPTVAAAPSAAAVPVAAAPVVSAPLVSAFVPAPVGAAPLPVAPAPAAQPAPTQYPSGGITQLLRAIDMSEVSAAKPMPAAVAASAPAASPDWSAPAPAPMGANAATTSPSLAQGSSLTSVLDVTPVAAPSPVAAPTVVSVAPPVSGSPHISAPTSSPLSAPIAASPQKPVAEDAGGSFTQLFRTLDRSAAASGPSAAAPPQASFTQVFSSASAKPARETSQADQFPPLPASAAPGFGEPAKGWEEPHFSSPPPTARPAYPGGGYAEAQPRMPEPAASSGGGGAGLTQLLRRLDGPGSATAAPSGGRAESLYPASAAAPQVDASMGFGAPASSGATTAFRLPQAPGAAAPAMPAAATGPGEFTGIVQASALRESARQGGGAGASPIAAAAPAPAASSGFSMPAGFSSIPGAPVMPTMPTASGGGGGGGFGAHQLPVLPTIPTIAGVTLPAPSAPAAGAGGGSKMLPILLMVVIVLLIAVLLAVVLMMKH